MTARQNVVEPLQDDAVNIAGWVFADLLLSLAVIFLASISFAVPGKSGDSVVPSSNSGANLNLQLEQSNTNVPITQGANFYYTKFDAKKIESDLSFYFARNNLSPASEVIYAQIAGGFNPNIEGSDKGTLRALAFSISMKKANLAAFGKSNFDLTTSSQLAPNQIALRLSFVPPLSSAN